MDKVRVSPAAGCAVRVCCDSMEGYDWKGRIYTRYRHEPAAFTNAGELIGILEDFCDWIGYPQASMIGRSFQETAPEDMKEKDVIAYYGGSDRTAIITHRVVENRVFMGEFVTKGDANPDEDMTPIPYEDFIGKVRLSIPRVGRAAQALSSTPGKRVKQGDQPRRWNLWTESFSFSAWLSSSSARAADLSAVAALVWTTPDI